MAQDCTVIVIDGFDRRDKAQVERSGTSHVGCSESTVTLPLSEIMRGKKHKGQTMLAHGSDLRHKVRSEIQL